MAVIVKNVGAMVPNSPSAHGDTKSPAATFGEVGTVRAIYQGQEHVFGPNQSKTFQDDGIGHGVAAFNSNLTVFPTDTWK